MKVRIYYNLENPELIYALTVLQEYYRGKNNFSLVAAEVVDYLIQYPPQAEEEVYILDISPQNEIESVTMEKFLGEYGHQIKLWINKADRTYNQVTWLNGDKEVIQQYHEPSCLMKLSDLGYHTNEYWIELANALARGDYTEDPKLARFYQAWFTSKIYYDNEKFSGLELFFQKAYQEIISDLETVEITKLNKAYGRIIENTRQACQKIKCQPPFKGIAKQEIGYADLGEITVDIDINKIIRVGKIRFPWLCITQYVYQGEQYTAIFSDQLKIKKLLGVKRQTLIMNKQTAIDLLREKIKEWNKKTA